MKKALPILVASLALMYSCNRNPETMHNTTNDSFVNAISEKRPDTVFIYTPKDTLTYVKYTSTAAKKTASPTFFQRVDRYLDRKDKETANQIKKSNEEFNNLCNKNK